LLAGVISGGYIPRDAWQPPERILTHMSFRSFH
jgi:hypothetical protein